VDEAPPPEAFEPQPYEPSGADRVRRRLQVALIVVLIAALVVLAAVQGGGLIFFNDDGSETGPRLAVVDATGTLTWMGGDGASPVTYAQPGLAFQFPAWSPDGTRIAAVGTDVDGGGVYVVRARASTDPPAEPTVIYQSADRSPFYLYWSPDGRQVSFLTTEPNGLALRVAAADGSGSAYVVRSGAPMYWDFVDADRMLVHSGSSGPDEFFGEVGLDGSPFEGTDRAAGIFRAPAVSSDGRYRAYFSAANDAIGEVVRESRDGTGTTRIRIFGPGAVAFSPVGAQLAFVAPDQPTSAALPLPVGPLRILDANAAEARTVIGGNVIAFFWSPNGREIAVLQLLAPDNPVTEARSGGPVGRSGSIVVARATAPGDVRYAVAGVGLQLSVVGAANGAIRSERPVQVSELFVNQVLPFFDQYALSHRFWSPDSAAIVLPIVGEDDATQLQVIPADGSEARIVATAEMGFWSP
jgi:TolB protein